MTFVIRAPATTANLGPGFDCLGLALDIWNEVEVSARGDALHIEIQGIGAETLPATSDNAIYRAMQCYAELHNKTLPAGLNLKCLNRIPLGSGLGSSSAAAVTGILAASAVLGIPTNLDDQILCACQLEGHPDNIAPCLLGGFVASFVEPGQIVARKLPIADLNLIIVHPAFDFPTCTARKALPKEVPYCDAVFNASHAILVAEALRNGDFDLLKLGMQDRLHQPYRLPLIPGAETAIEAAKKAGAVAVVLSGAGPSLLAISPDKSYNSAIAGAMETAFSRVGLVSQTFFPKISQSGAACITK